MLYIMYLFNFFVLLDRLLGLVLNKYFCVSTRQALNDTSWSTSSKEKSKSGNSVSGMYSRRPKNCVLTNVHVLRVNFDNSMVAIYIFCGNFTKLLKTNKNDRSYIYIYSNVHVDFVYEILLAIIHRVTKKNARVQYLLLTPKNRRTERRDTLISHLSTRVLCTRNKIIHEY